MASTESLSDAGLHFLEKFFKENNFALARHHIDSFEHCLFDEIPSIIHASNPIVLLKGPLDREAGIYEYRIEVFLGGDVKTPEELGLSISPPIVVLDDGNTVRRMFPNEARLRLLTYASQINIDIQVRVTFTRPAATGYETEVIDAPMIRGFPLFRMPILLRSRFCTTFIEDPVLLEEMGECRNDYGGYFIVDGQEKVLVTRGEQAFNSLYVEKKVNDPQTLAYASVISLHPETKQTRRVALYMMKNGEIRVAVPMIRGAFPLFILFRAMGVESDEEIVRLIFPDAKDPLQEELIPTIQDAYPIYNKYTAIQYIKTLTKGFTEAHVLDILQNLMLPHVPDEPFARAQYLAEMARETVRASLGLVTKTDRDDMRNQRFLSTGVLVRELFNGCWKDWRKAVIETIDRTYRSNEAMYKDDKIFELFAKGILMNIFQPMTLNKALMRGFRGKWGTNEMNEKTGVLQPLARISYLDAMSHIRRVVSVVENLGSAVTGPRKLHTSQIGYFCTSETPQGQHIGITKNMSMMTQYSIGAPTQAIYDWMKMKGGLIPVIDTTPELRASPLISVVKINGGTVGFTMDPRGLTQVLKLFKWNAFLAPTASVSFNTTERTVNLLLDESRLIRPLWHLNGEGPAYLERLKDLKMLSWNALVFGTHPASVNASMRTTRFLDPLGDQPAATFADYMAALTPTAGFIEYCDPTEMNEAYISWWGSAEDLTPDHTHAEIHPSTLTGLLASMIPFANHNQSPRNQLSCSQSKQGIGTIVTNLSSRYDTDAHQLCYGEAPICRTFMYETVGNGDMAYGFNCIIAATSESGYNQDDGLIINRDSVARGMFQSLSFRSYDCAEEVDPRTKVHSHIVHPSSVPTWAPRPGLDYSKLDERGIIREGEMIDDKTVLVGRYMVIPETNEVKDASVKAALHTVGRVDSVVVLHQGQEVGNGRGQLLVKIRIIKMRLPQLGDKFSSRHGQKGTIGMLISAADLPRTADGIVPDVMVNPGGFISRMTVAQLLEMVGGRLGAEVAAKMNATSFCNGGDFVKQVGEMLEQVGAHRSGDNVLYSGITGQQIRTDIFMCPLYFMRLKHLTDDKLNARGEGPMEVRTHQPTGGRANEGGLRIGEMERDSLCAHGISAFLQESMMKRGDGTDFWICNGCGTMPIYNEAEGLMVCPLCDGPLEFSGLTAETRTLHLPVNQSRATFSKISMPYAMKLLDQELSAFMNTGLRFISGAAIAKLRDNGWNWPALDVDFKEVERTERESGAVNPEAAAAMASATEAASNKKAKRTRNKGAAVSAATTTASLAGAAEVTKVVPSASNSSSSSAAATAGPTAVGPAAVEPVQFSDSLMNQYAGFNPKALAPFRITNKQFPTPDGKPYPDFSFSMGSAGENKTTWPTVEHYYQAMRFPDFPKYQVEIYDIPVDKPRELQNVARAPSTPARGDWDAIKDRVMEDAMKAKFRQNLDLLQLLQETGTRTIQYADKDPYWGTSTNRLGRILMKIRTDLKDVRADELAFASSSSSSSSAAAGPEEETLVEQAQKLVKEGGDIVKEGGDNVAAATQGMVQLQQGGGAAGQGIYLFINPAMGGSVEGKARRARDRGRSRDLSWEGMTVDKQDGGSPAEEMSIESGQTTEVKVEKLGT